MKMNKIRRIYKDNETAHQGRNVSEKWWDITIYPKEQTIAFVSNYQSGTIIVNVYDWIRNFNTMPAQELVFAQNAPALGNLYPSYMKTGKSLMPRLTSTHMDKHEVKLAFANEHPDGNGAEYDNNPDIVKIINKVLEDEGFFEKFMNEGRLPEWGEDE